MALIERISAQRFSTSKWSGGSTTELFIWPKDASYAERRFNIRISTATVDVESSTFTRLEGVTRCITPLGAGFTLTIGDGEPEFIPHGAVKRFNGAENVACAGRGRDLNLMLKGAEGELIMLKTGEAHRIERCEFVFAYSVEGGKLSFGDACIHAGAGEFFRLASDKEETVNPSGETAIFCCKAGK